MRNKAESKKGQSGQILLYTTIIVMLAALILVPLMQFAFTSHRSATIREERTLELYASDAGIEDALYQIKTEKKGTDLANLGFGEDSSYDVGALDMNDRDVNVSVQKVWIPEGDEIPSASQTDAPVNNDTTPFLDTDKSDKLVVVGMLNTIQAPAASDDFSSGGWSGSGSGDDGNWTGSWTHTTGSTSIVSSGGCDGNTLKFADAPGTATRTANLLKYMKPELKFTAKAVSLEGDDTVDLNVTYGNSTGNYTETVASWTTGNVTCDPYDFNLYDLYGWETGNDTTPSTLKIDFDADFSTEVTATDDFSSGGFGGGLNWYSTPWTTSGSGSASVMNDGANAHSPNYDVKLSGNGYVMRRVRLASGTTPQITVWAKQSGFGSSDYAYLKVSTRTNPNPSTSSDWSSPNGETKKTWNSSSSPSYTSYTYDLSTYAGQNIWILFSGSMSSTGTTIASDGFESGWTNSGTGWAGVPWVPSPTNSGVTTSGSPRNSRHLWLNRQGYAEREINLSSYGLSQLRYYYKMSNNWETSGSQRDHGYLKIYLNGSLYDTVDLNYRTSYSSSASTYNLPQGQITIRFESNTNDNSEYLYIDDINVVYFPCFYFDDVSVTHAIGTDSDSFYVDNLWIVDEYNSNTIEIAYTDAAMGNVYLDRIGVWMPPGCHYISAVGNETTPALYKEPPTTILSDTYAGGTILEWDYGNVALHLPSGQVPIVKTLTFAYKVDVAQTVEGMFTWIKAHGPSDQTYISWDKGYEIYKAVSQAHSEIYGSNTQVTAYAAQGEVNKRNAVSYGDYVATGNPLLFDYNLDGNGIKERAIDPTKDPVLYPSDPSRWTWDQAHTYYYDGRSDVTTVPADGEVVSAWLYWSAFIRNADWTAPDENVSFMYPYGHGPESFSVADNMSSESYTISSYTSAQEPMDLLTDEPGLTLYPFRYWSENLGTAVYGNETFFTAHKPISSTPAPKVWVSSVLRTAGTDYVINYPTGNVTLTKPGLSGTVIIDYSVPGSKTLAKGTDYTINQVAEGAGYKYTGFTVINDKLVGTVTIDYYYAKHWQAVQHAAQDGYGTPLDPVEEPVPPASPVGHAYACFADVTNLLEAAAGSSGKHPGNGQYAVGNVTATPGPSSGDYALRCFSGWSLIIVYQSETETAHQFYRYDPIHNNDHDGILEEGECPFQKVPNSADTNFKLTDFYPPQGTVDGRTTYFVGEGDIIYDYDYVEFKGESQSTYTTLYGPNNPESGHQTMNTICTDGARGIDIDTFDIFSEVGSDHAADVRLHTDEDRWYVVYMILSFKTNQVPKADYAFSVASVTYQYELGAQ